MKKGFTLIELMLAVAIIGLLSSVALPKAAELIRRSKEAATKGNLAAIRSAITIFYADHDGNFPQYIHTELVEEGKYLAKIPNVFVPLYHTRTPRPEDSVIYFNQFTPIDMPTQSWGYVQPFTPDDPPVKNDSPDVGTIYIPCTHTDARGVVWYRN